jgi:hypothetical protein
MQPAHLFLEAVRRDRPLSGMESDPAGVFPRSGALGVMLDRRVAALRGAMGPAAALLGFTLLPWCDVTLWSVVLAPSARMRSGGEVRGRAPGPGHAWASAWMRIEIDHVDCALAYVERLPVERSLVSKAWRWRWSSAPWHCGFGAKPIALAPEWSGPVRRDLCRERLAGAFVGRSDRSLPVTDTVPTSVFPSPPIAGSAVDRLSLRTVDHSPGMPSRSPASAEEIEPSHGELAVA